jgi:hypothetical protein
MPKVYPVECLPNEMFTQLNFKPFNRGNAYFIGAKPITTEFWNSTNFYINRWSDLPARALQWQAGATP